MKLSPAAHIRNKMFKPHEKETNKAAFILTFMEYVLIKLVILFNVL